MELDSELLMALRFIEKKHLVREFKKFLDKQIEEETVEG